MTVSYASRNIDFKTDIKKIGREWCSWEANNRRCKLNDQKRIYCSEIANES